MLENPEAKLLVYASNLAPENKRFQSISDAAKKMAKLLKLPLEVVTFKEEFDLIYVYYKNGEEEPVPIFCDNGGEFKIQEIYKALTNMMFVLSFHPKHSALQQIRGKFRLFS